MSSLRFAEGRYVGVRGAVVFRETCSVSGAMRRLPQNQKACEGMDVIVCGADVVFVLLTGVLYQYIK